MGDIASKLPRSLRNINVKNRAFQLISKEKPKRAPHHPTTVKYLEKMLMQASPPVTKTTDRIHLQRLKQIYVTSTAPPEVQVTKSESVKTPKLPFNKKKSLSELPFGYLEPSCLPRGKVTLRQALSFIACYHSEPVKWTGEPQKWSVGFISQQYGLRSQDTRDILKHFTPFKTYVSDEEGSTWHSNTRKLRKMTANKPKLISLKNE